jgi:hypothetical protein
MKIKNLKMVMLQESVPMKNQNQRRSQKARSRERLKRKE